MESKRNTSSTNHSLLPETPSDIDFSLWPEQAEETIEEKFIGFMYGRDDWISAKKIFIENPGIDICLMDGYPVYRNILYFAADYLVGKKKGEEGKSDINAQLEALYWLVDYAAQRNITLNISDHEKDNVLHYIASCSEKELLLAFLDKLLTIAKPEDINFYNAAGKTPLLVAIECGNVQTALKLISHPDIDVNLYKIEAQKGHSNGEIKPGTSSLDAAQQFGMTDVAKKIKEHKNYNPNISYISLINVEFENAHYQYAAQGNIDTLKVIFRQYGPDMLSTQDAIGWTILHVACCSGNLPIIEFLLNKEELDKIFGQNQLTNDEYSDFVNQINENYDSALAVGFNHSATRLKQIELFVRCPFYNINMAFDIGYNTLLHDAVRNNWIEVIELIAKHRSSTADFMVLDGEGNTPLRIACEEGHYEIVSLFEKLSISGIDIGLNEYGQKMPISKHFTPFAEESTFGQDILKITKKVKDGDKEKYIRIHITDLNEVYERKETLKVYVTYRKPSYKLNINFSTPISEEQELKKYIEYCIRYYNDILQTISCLDVPEWVDHDLYPGLLELLQNANWKEKSESIDEMTIAHLGSRIKIKKISDIKSFEIITETGTIDFNLLKDLTFTKGGAKVHKRLTKRKPEPLLEVVARKKDPRLFAALLKFKNLNLNDPLSKRVDGLIQDSKEMQDLFAKARKDKFPTYPVYSGKDKNIQKLVETIRKNESITEFYMYFSQKYLVQSTIEKGRRFHKRKDEIQNRRLDALARLIEGDGVCSAVCFDGEYILVSSNTPNNVNLNKLLKETKEYFSSYARSEFKTQEDQNNEKLKLITNVCFLKCLAKFDSDKQNHIKTELLQPLLNDLVKNYNTLIQLKLTFENGLLSKKSLDDILIMCKENESKYREAAKRSFPQSHDNYLNSFCRTIVRIILDIAKIEQSLISRDQTKRFSETLIAAFCQQKIVDIDSLEQDKEKKEKEKKDTDKEKDNIHAEMRIINYIIKKGGYSRTKKYYIGISKLCCSHCNLIIDAFGNFSKDYKDQTFETRGMHIERYKSWAIPDFMKTKEGFAKIFVADTFIVNSFKIAYDKDKDTCLNVIRHIGELVGLLKRENGFYMGHDWSSSAPSLFDKKSYDQRMADIDHLLPAPQKQYVESDDKKVEEVKSNENIQNINQIKKIFLSLIEYMKNSIVQEESKNDTEIMKGEENYSEKLQLNAKKFGFNCIDVARDGFCLLHAISEQLSRLNKRGVVITPYTYEELHTMLVDHVLENIESYKNVSALNPHTFVGQAIDYQENWDSDLGDIASLALSRELNMTIVIIPHDDTLPKIWKRSNPIATLYLGHERGMHYQSLSSIENLEFKPIENIDQYIQRHESDLWNKPNTHTVLPRTGASTSDYIQVAEQMYQSARESSDASLQQKDLVEPKKAVATKGFPPKVIKDSEGDVVMATLFSPSSPKKQASSGQKRKEKASEDDDAPLSAKKIRKS